ncbi:MAG TPA: DUF4142 domain-containing protein [Longimicrobiales bacterium]|nr:DUF4142 domain-containing protein [Longimicrobiales bacterium]
MNRILPLILPLILAGCGGSEEEEPRPASPPAVTAEPEPRQPTTYPEHQAVQIMHVIDSARIAIARAVRDQTGSEVIAEFARVLIVDHRAITALLDTALVNSGQLPADNAVSEAMRAETQQFIEQLMTRDTGLNNGFLAHEIREHEHALQLLDTTIIPSARDTAIKGTLERIRPAFEAHLQQARRILAAREAAARRETEPGSSVPVTPRQRPDTIRPGRAQSDTTRLPRR